METPAAVVLFRCGRRRPDGQHPIPAWMPLCREDVNQLETPWRKDTRVRGMSPKVLGRFITEECSHSWRWAVMVPAFTSQEGCSGQGGLVCCVSTKDRARTDMRQIVTQDGNESKLPLGGGYTERNYAFMLHTWGEKGDEESVFFLCVLHPPPEAFSVVCMEHCMHSSIDGV